MWSKAYSLSRETTETQQEHTSFKGRTPASHNYKHRHVNTHLKGTQVYLGSIKVSPGVKFFQYVGVCYEMKIKRVAQ